MSRILGDQVEVPLDPPPERDLRIKRPREVLQTGVDVADCSPRTTPLPISRTSIREPSAIWSIRNDPSCSKRPRAARRPVVVGMAADHARSAAVGPLFTAIDGDSRRGSPASSTIRPGRHLCGAHLDRRHLIGGEHPLPAVDRLEAGSQAITLRSTSIRFSATNSPLASAFLSAASGYEVRTAGAQRSGPPPPASVGIDEADPRSALSGHDLAEVDFTPTSRRSGKITGA